MQYIAIYNWRRVQTPVILIFHGYMWTKSRKSNVTSLRQHLITEINFRACFSHKWSKKKYGKDADCISAGCDLASAGSLCADCGRMWKPGGETGDLDLREFISSPQRRVRVSEPLWALRTAPNTAEDCSITRAVYL